MRSCIGLRKICIEDVYIKYLFIQLGICRYVWNSCELKAIHKTVPLTIWKSCAEQMSIAFHRYYQTPFYRTLKNGRFNGYSLNVLTNFEPTKYE